MQTLIVNTLDKQRLAPLLNSAGHPPGPLAVLRDILDAAETLPPPQVPADVVTMNSTVRVRFPNEDESELLTLVYPDGDPDSRQGVSVLAPLGAGLFARRLGEQVRWMGARGPRCAILENIEYQPERAGHFDR